MSLPAGNWTFEVRATDLAGNAEAAPYASHAWQLSLPAAYVALTGGDLGATVQRCAILLLPAPLAANGMQASEAHCQLAGKPKEPAPQERIQVL